MLAAPLAALTAPIWLAVCSPVYGLFTSTSLTRILDVGGTKGVSRVQPVKDGGLLTFEIRSWPNDPSKERLDRGHVGPCAVYLKKVDSASTDSATGDGWFKIFDHGYDSSTKRWCTDEIIDNNGLLSVNLPKGLEGGDYLARPEILALHAAADGDPQFYTGCAQIFLESSGNLVPESTVSIPGYVKYGEPGTSFNIYSTDASEYEIPGPKVAKLTSGGAQSASETVLKQTDGLKPEGCIMENGNWCGKEVPDYTDSKGCWAAGKNCYDQAEKCFDSAPPTGNKNCILWQDKCKAINAECEAYKFVGPPNKGKVLTPVKKAIDVGKIMPTSGGGIIDAPAPKSKAESKTQAAAAKATPAAEEEFTTSTFAAVTPKPTVDDSYQSPPIIDQEESSAPSKSNVPVSTMTVAPSSANAPAPTAGPVCPEGWKCVTTTHVQMVTQTVYVTATPDSYKKRATVHERRHLYRA
jgi:hypothetical protein